MSTVKFQCTETIVSELEVRDQNSVLVDPSSVPKIDITDPDGTSVVTAQNMTKTAVGKYSHDYTPAAAAVPGWYGVKFTVTDGGRVTIARDGFDLEA
jgi:hypothetical protein